MHGWVPTIGAVTGRVSLPSCSKQLLFSVFSVQFAVCLERHKIRRTATIRRPALHNRTGIPAPRARRTRRASRTTSAIHRVPAKRAGRTQRIRGTQAEDRIPATRGMAPVPRELHILLAPLTPRKSVIRSLRPPP